ncbi:MAG: hypothetical protein [Microviridae sp.]|nr:MAG: hypothetical protein [Microviridae sp.]
MPKFHSYFENPPKKLLQDCSDPYVDQYIEIAPFSFDEKTGQILNKSCRPILQKSNERFNIDAYIQSFKDECDIKAILVKFSETGDYSLINKRVGSFTDIVNIPNNIHDFMSMNADLGRKLKEMSPELQDAIKSGSVENLSALIADQVKKVLVAKGVKIDEGNKVETPKVEEKKGE